MSSFERMDKLNSQFCKEICRALSSDVKNPNITEMYTILSVDADCLLSSAKVFVSIYSTNSERANKTLDAIKNSEPVIRRAIAKRMRIRKVPKFEFILDETFKKGQKIEELINEIHKNDNN